MRLRLAWALAAAAPCTGAADADWVGGAAEVAVSSVKSMASPAPRADGGGGWGTAGADKAGGCRGPQDQNSSTSQHSAAHF